MYTAIVEIPCAPYDWQFGRMAAPVTWQVIFISGVFMIVLFLQRYQYHDNISLSYLSPPSAVTEGLSEAQLLANGLRLTFAEPLQPFSLNHLHYSAETLTDAQAEVRFYELVTPHQIECKDQIRLGNIGDGGWDMCVSGIYNPHGYCLVYSFGINNDFTFDDAVGDQYHCEVHSFDPSMKVDDHKRNEYVNFHKLGLLNEDKITRSGWKVATLQTIQDNLSHSQTVIDYLKFDIEYSEWAALPNMIATGSLKNVKQMSFEIHIGQFHLKQRGARSYAEQYEWWYEILRMVEEQGFRRYLSHVNPATPYHSPRTGMALSCCIELYYVNLRFLESSINNNK